MSELLRDRFHHSIVCEGAVRVAADADRVWALVGNIGDASLAKGFVDRVEVFGAGAGAVRHLHLPGGAVIVERIEEYDAAERYYVYRVIDHGPTEFTRYLAMASVVRAGPGACLLSWVTMAQPLTGCDAAARAQLQGNIDFILHAVREHFAAAAAA